MFGSFRNISHNGDDPYCEIFLCVVISPLVNSFGRCLDRLYLRRR
jgi:hypothetical protein